MERQGGHEVGGAPRGAPSTLVTASGASWSRVQVSWITVGEKITFPKVSFRLIFPFFEILKQVIKQQFWAEPLVSRLVPKII